MNTASAMATIASEHVGKLPSLHNLLDVENMRLIDWDAFLDGISSEKIAEVDEMESTVLYKAIKKGAPLHVIKRLVKEAPNLLEQYHPISGFLPLHEACHPQNNNQNKFLKIRQNATHHLVVLALLDAYPKACVVVSSHDDMLPLHALMQHRPPLSLVKAMVEKMAEVDDAERSIEDLLLLKDADEQTPLQLALQFYAPVDTTIYLIEQSHRSVYQPGHEEFLPLHNAIYFGTTLPILKKFLEVHHGGLMTKENVLKTTALEIAFHEHVAPRWQADYKPEGVFPDGTSPDGSIEGPPLNLLSLPDLMDHLLKSLLRRFNTFTKTRDINKISRKVLNLYRKALTPLIAKAKTCRKIYCHGPTPDLDQMIGQLEKEKSRT